MQTQIKKMSSTNPLSYLLYLIGFIGINNTVIVTAEEQNISSEGYEEILITGSRIQRKNIVSATPTTTISNEEISTSGSVSLVESIQDIPSMGTARNNGNTARSSSNLGSQQIDLRDLGAQRTLVLVNGRRYAPAGANGIVDTSAIPVAIVDRVETITGGASAIYGSEAIAGVVNIILNDHFEGLLFNSHYGVTEEGDGQQYRFNMTAGGNFSDDKGNGLIHLDISDTKGILNKDRSISRTTGSLVDNPADTGPDDGLPAEIWEPDYGRSTTIPSGRYSIPGVGTRVIDPVTGELRSFQTPEDRYRFDGGHLTVPLQTINAFGQATYEVNDHFDMFAEISFSNTQSFRIIEAAGENVSNIPLTNPNIPQVVLDAIAAGDEPDATELGVRRRFTEFGTRHSDYERNSMRIAFGFNGMINDNWHYDSYYQFGRNTASNENFGRMRMDHLAATLSPENCDNFNTIQIQSQAARCPGSIDLFTENSITQEFIDFIGYQDVRTGKSQQQVIAANVTGVIAELPAGPLDIAIGFENRKEKNDNIPSAIIQDGQSTSNLAPQTKGSFDVTEYYAEAIIPLINGDMNMMKKLELEVAARNSDYSTVGDLTSWKAGFSWLPADTLRIRAMHARAFRAPNVDELFRGNNESFNSATDPCNNGGNAGVVADNCASHGIDDTFTQPESRLRSIVTGNTHLTEERADTTTFGFVYLPDEGLFDGLSLAMDWFDISIKDAITTPDVQTILDLCYVSANLSDSACLLIDRAADGELTEIRRAALNTGLLETSGLDFEAHYKVELDSMGIGDGDLGALDFRFNYTYLDDYNEEAFPGSDTIHYEGTLGTPENRFVLRTNYEYADWAISWTFKFLGEVNVDPDRTDGETGAKINGRGREDIEGYRVSSQTYSNLAFKYQFNEIFRLNIGISNLFDRDLPLVTMGGRQNTKADFYDFRGRAFYAGLSAEF